MKKVGPVWLALFLALILLPQAATDLNNSTYDPMADVDKDGVIDVYDLARLAEAYGTTQTVPIQSNQTVVYVYQLETDPPQVENACVAIAELPLFGGSNVVQVGYTNSSGMANFTLSPNVNYTAIAWSNKTYNYANFTTNEHGETSAIIQLGHPHLPPNWVVTTIVNATSSALLQENLNIFWFPLAWNNSIGQWEVIGGGGIATVVLGVYFCGPQFGMDTEHWVAMAWRAEEYLAEAGFTPDENGNAFVVIYV